MLCWLIDPNSKKSDDAVTFLYKCKTWNCMQGSTLYHSVGDGYGVRRKMDANGYLCHKSQRKFIEFKRPAKNCELYGLTTLYHKVNLSQP